MTTKRVNAGELSFEDGVWHEGDLFTGTAVEAWDDGTPRAEQEYLQGAKHGLGRAWSRTGRLVEEVPYRHGVQHGVGRWWHEDGAPSVEKTAKFGIVLARKVWDQSGALVEEYAIDEDDWQYRRVQKLEREEGGG